MIREYTDKIKNIFLICVYTLLNIFSNIGQYIDTVFLVHLTSYVCVLYLFNTNQNLFFNLILLDTIIKSVRFIKTLYVSSGVEFLEDLKRNTDIENDYIMRKLKFLVLKQKVDVIQENSYFSFISEPEINYIEKYSLFLSMFSISMLIDILFWSKITIYINALLLLSAIPFFNIAILNFIYFKYWHNYLVSKIKFICSYLLSYTTVRIINDLSKYCLDLNPKIDSNELMDFYETSLNLNKQDSSLNPIPQIQTLLFIRSVIGLTIIIYIKQTNNVLYTKICDFVYKYHIGESFFFPLKSETVEMNIKKKETYISNIIYNRKWTEFFQLKTLNMLLELYENKEDLTFNLKIKTIFRNIFINIRRLTMLLSISMISPILCVCIDSYFVFINNKFYMFPKIKSHLVSCLILLFMSPTVGALCIVCSDFIIEPVLAYTTDSKIIEKYIIKNFTQLSYYGIVCLIYQFKYFSLGIPLFLQYFNPNIKYNFLIYVLIGFSHLSDFSLFHIIIVWTSLNIGYNLYKIYVRANYNSKQNEHDGIKLDYDSDSDSESKSDITNRIFENYLNVKKNRFSKTYYEKKPELIKVNSENANPSNNVNNTDLTKSTRVCKWVSDTVYSNLSGYTRFM